MDKMTKDIAVRFIELMNETLFSSELEQLIDHLQMHPDMPISDLNMQGWIEGEETMCEAFEDCMKTEFFQNSDEHKKIWADAWKMVKDMKFVAPDQSSAYQRGIGDVEQAIEFLSALGYVVIKSPDDEELHHVFNSYFFTEGYQPLHGGEENAIRDEFKDKDRVDRIYADWVNESIQDVLDAREEEEGGGEADD